VQHLVLFSVPCTHPAYADRRLAGSRIFFPMTFKFHSPAFPAARAIRFLLCGNKRSGAIEPPTTRLWSTKPSALISRGSGVPRAIVGILIANPPESERKILKV